MNDCPFCALISDADRPNKIVEFTYSIAYLNLDQSYRGKTIVVFKEHFDTLLEVPKDIFDAANAEMLKIASALDKAFVPDRLNFAILGNVVPHVHWHIVPRYKADPNWGGPPWPIRQRYYASDTEFKELVAIVRSALEDPVDTELNKHP